MCRQHRVQDSSTILVVNALGVRLGITVGHELLHQSQTGGLVHLQHFVQTVPIAVDNLLPQQIGQILRSVHLAVFRHHLLAPNGACIQKFLVGDRLEILGACQVQTLVVAALHDSEVERLYIHRELVLTKLDDILAVDEQLLLVL